MAYKMSYEIQKNFNAFGYSNKNTLNPLLKRCIRIKWQNVLSIGWQIL